MAKISCWRLSNRVAYKKSVSFFVLAYTDENIVMRGGISEISIFYQVFNLLWSPNSRNYENDFGIFWKCFQYCSNSFKFMQILGRFFRLFHPPQLIMTPKFINFQKISLTPPNYYGRESIQHIDKTTYKCWVAPFPAPYMGHALKFTPNDTRYKMSKPKES